MTSAGSSPRSRATSAMGRRALFVLMSLPVLSSARALEPDARAAAARRLVDDVLPLERAPVAGELQAVLVGRAERAARLGPHVEELRVARAHRVRREVPRALDRRVDAPAAARLEVDVSAHGAAVAEH